MADITFQDFLEQAGLSAEQFAARLRQALRRRHADDGLADLDALTGTTSLESVTVDLDETEVRADDEGCYLVAGRATFQIETTHGTEALLPHTLYGTYRARVEGGEVGLEHLDIATSPVFSGDEVAQPNDD
ncbi:MAG: hypothetical protein U5L04_13265 [Trueperaceae bacterium]|nr:hypothetical protein [Trueperaceae bacterium]